MRAEWLRRLVCVGMGAVAARTVRQIEPWLDKRTDIPTVWITMTVGLATMVICFRLADRIPDSHWPTGLRLVTVGHLTFALIMTIWIVVLVGLSAGRVH